jgi:hypothetical protein
MTQENPPPCRCGDAFILHAMDAASAARAGFSHGQCMSPICDCGLYQPDPKMESPVNRELKKREEKVKMFQMMAGERPIHVLHPEKLAKDDCYICGHKVKLHNKKGECSWEKEYAHGTAICGIAPHKPITWLEAQRMGYGNPPRRMHLLKKGAVEVAEQLMKTASPEARVNLAQEAAVKEAQQLGHNAGSNAAEWVAQDVLGGRAAGDVRERAKIMLTQYEAGDPALMDRFKVPDLSGEYSGDLTPAMLLSQLGLENADEEIKNEVTQAWEDAAQEGFWDTLMTAARRVVEISEPNPPRRRRIVRKKSDEHKCKQDRWCGMCSNKMCDDCSCKGVGQPDTCLICYGGPYKNPAEGGLTVVGERAILVETSGGSVTRGMGRVLGLKDGSILIEGTFKGSLASLKRFISGRLLSIAYYDVRKAKAEGKPNPRLPWKHDFSTEQVSMKITQRGLHISSDRPLWGIQ